MASLGSKSYCDALFSLAQEENNLDSYKEQFTFVSESVANDAQYRAIMSHPKISKEDKKEMLDIIYGDNIHRTLLNFLKLLVDKGRFQALMDIKKEFVKSYNLANDIQVVYVKSASSLSDTESIQLKDTLEHKLQKKVDFIFSIDTDLMAGISIKINDQVIDNTALGKLHRLKYAVQHMPELNNEAR